MKQRRLNELKARQTTEMRYDVHRNTQIPTLLQGIAVWYVMSSVVEVAYVVAVMEAWFERYISCHLLPLLS